MKLNKSIFYYLPPQTGQVKQRLPTPSKIQTHTKWNQREKKFTLFLGSTSKDDQTKKIITSSATKHQKTFEIKIKKYSFLHFPDNQTKILYLLNKPYTKINMDLKEK